MNAEEDTKFLSLAGPILKQLGQKIAKGDFNVATITKPIAMTATITMSECLTL